MSNVDSLQLMDPIAETATRKPMVHHIRRHPEYFQAVLEGKKPFELRVNDRDYRVGDQIIIQEWDPGDGRYSGRAVDWIIGYLIQDQKWLQPGCCAFAPSIGRVNTEAIALLNEVKDYLDFDKNVILGHKSRLHLKLIEFLNRDTTPEN